MKLSRFIYNGFHYPVIGSSVGWNGGKTATVISKRFGPWDSWWGFEYGIKVRLSNPERPYNDMCISHIKINKEMNIIKDYCSMRDGSRYPEKPKYNDYFVMYSVHTNDGEYIGEIGSAYFVSDLEDFRPYRKGSTTICAGWDPKTETAHGWSHRARVGFKKGDKIYQSGFGDDSTLFTQHGTKDIKTKEDAMISAVRFAKDVS